jgi:hypothetical protein
LVIDAFLNRNIGYISFMSSSDENKERANGKLHCWDFINCPESVRFQCPVYLEKGLNCWEYDNTACRKIIGFNYNCEDCKYYLSRKLVNEPE